MGLSSLFLGNAVRKEEKPNLLLHVCCAPCSPYVVELLSKEFHVTAYFYDPNIHPEEEYRFRLEEMKKMCAGMGLGIIEAEYDPDRWFQLVEGHEKDPEKGERCGICFRMRLEQAAKFAGENGFSAFATALSVSPHKDAKAINRIGREIGNAHGVVFLEADFKKKNGFKISVEKGRELGLKRQDYCGCVFSA
ncbi:MAG: epoxyqueuosine reductase QueH [Nitrospinae bacterium]|nr:epoxyqueuosine reductase QueH [Nitrospinota bacterium]